MKKFYCVARLITYGGASAPMIDLETHGKQGYREAMTWNTYEGAEEHAERRTSADGNLYVVMEATMLLRRQAVPVERIRL